MTCSSVTAFRRSARRWQRYRRPWRCSPDWAVAVLDSAAWEAADRIDEMRRHAARLQHLAGIGNVRAALSLVRTGAQTPLESLSRLRLVRCGLPEPRLQVPFWDEEGLIGIVDMYFEELGVIGEADGMLKYRTGDDLIREKRREDRLRRRKPVVRWGWERIWTDPAEHRPTDPGRRRMATGGLTGTGARGMPRRAGGSPSGPGYRDKREGVSGR